MKIKPLYLSWEYVDLENNITEDIYIVFSFQYHGHRSACNVRMNRTFLDSIKIDFGVVVDLITKYIAKGVNRYTNETSITSEKLHESVREVIINAFHKKPFVFDYKKKPIQ